MTHRFKSRQRGMSFLGVLVVGVGAVVVVDGRGAVVGGEMVAGGARVAGGAVVADRPKTSSILTVPSRHGGKPTASAR